MDNRLDNRISPVNISSGSSTGQNSSVPDFSISDRNFNISNTYRPASATLPYFDSASVYSSAPNVSTTESVSDSAPHSASVEPRRSGRQRKPPDRYGEWISNQQIIWNTDPDQTEYFL